LLLLQQDARGFVVREQALPAAASKFLVDAQVFAGHESRNSTSPTANARIDVLDHAVALSKANAAILDGLEYAAIETVQRHSGITCLRIFAGISHSPKHPPRALGRDSQSRLCSIQP
jgi:hypothetical protein